MSEILLINGPNLGRLGKRNPQVYGKTTIDEVIQTIERVIVPLGFKVVPYNSNHEGAIIDFIEAHHGSKGMIINPGALMMGGWSLRDALEDYPSPIIEVHISNLWKRELFRHESVISPVVDGIISGCGVFGYKLAAFNLCNIIN